MTIFDVFGINFAFLPVQVTVCETELKLFMPRLVRFLSFYAALGFAVALAFTVLIIAFDIASLRSLIRSSSDKWLVLSSLVIVLSITFASVAMGIAVMLLPHSEDDDDDDRPGGGRRTRIVPHYPIGGPARIRVPVKHRINTRPPHRR